MKSAYPFFDNLYLSDGGLETTLVFQRQLDLPYFAAFNLMRSPHMQQHLESYYRSYLEIYRKHNAGFVLETPTWRASADWAKKLDISFDELSRLNIDSVWMLRDLAKQYEQDNKPIIISGNLGPRGDGYKIAEKMSVAEANSYHSQQIHWFKQAKVDVITAVTINYVEEAAGIVQAAKEANLPCVIAFTVEIDGLLPDGRSLQEAIAIVDSEADGGPVHYMINCAHPSHYLQPVLRGGDWLQRIGGLRSNASVMSHAELDDSTELDQGDLNEFLSLHNLIRGRLPNLKVIGGCCGTDCKHIEGLAHTCLK